MEIIFEQDNGDEFSIEVGNNDTVVQIKEKIHETRGISISNQITLVIDGRYPLNDEMIIHSHPKIQAGSNIQLRVATTTPAVAESSSPPLLPTGATTVAVAVAESSPKVAVAVAESSPKVDVAVAESSPKVAVAVAESSSSSLAQPLPTGIMKTDSGKFAAQIYNPMTKRTLYLGTHESIDDASNVYNKKKKEFDEIKMKMKMKKEGRESDENKEEEEERETFAKKLARELLSTPITLAKELDPDQELVYIKNFMNEEVSNMLNFNGTSSRKK